MVRILFDVILIVNVVDSYIIVFVKVILMLILNFLRVDKIL